MSWLRWRAQPTLKKSFFVGGIVIASVFVVALQVEWMKRQRPRYTDTSVLQFTRITDQQTLRVFCDGCEGSGLVRDPADSEHMVICPICTGLGLHPVRFLDDGDVLCPTCRGLGRVGTERYDTAAICPRCGGNGSVLANWEKLKIPVQKAVCDHCDGRGVLRKPDNPVQLERCPVCFGLGSHLVRRMDGSDQYCPACQGMGRLIDEESGEARWCQLCEGRGLVFAPSAEAVEAAAPTAP